MAHGKTLVLKKGSLCQDSACLSTWVPNKQTNKQTNKIGLLSAKKNLIKIGRIGHLVLDVNDLLLAKLSTLNVQSDNAFSVARGRLS
jgi:hypothetical protein